MIRKVGKIYVGTVYNSKTTQIFALKDYVVIILQTNRISKYLLMLEKNPYFVENLCLWKCMLSTHLMWLSCTVFRYGQCWNDGYW